MDPYFLRTARLGFRQWSPSDIGLAGQLWGDVRVTRFIGGPFTEEQVRERLRSEIASQESDRIQYWPVFRLSDNAHVGCCGLRPYPGKESIREIGFHIRFEHWRRGYASEAACAVIDSAFRTLGVGGLFAGHHPQNDGSRRLLLRLGFRHTHDELYPPTGLNHPSYMLTREEFFDGPSSLVRASFQPGP